MASIRESLLDPMQVDHDAPAAKASKRAGSKWCTFKRFLVALIVVALAAVGVVFRNQFSAGGGGGGGGGSPMPPAPAPAPPAPAFNIGGISTGFDMMRALPLTSTTPIVGSFTKGLTAINGDAIPDGASVDNGADGPGVHVNVEHHIYGVRFEQCERARPHGILRIFFGVRRCVPKCRTAH